MEQKLALAIGSLVAALGRVRAPVILQVQLAVPRGQAVSNVGVQLLEEFPHCATRDAWGGGEIPHLSDILQHLTRGAAATIAVAEGHEQRWSCARFAPILLLEVAPGLEGLFG